MLKNLCFTLLMVGIALAAKTPPSSGSCPAFGSCTSNDVVTTLPTQDEYPVCDGLTATAHISVTVTSKADRFDIGFFVSTDGKPIGTDNCEGAALAFDSTTTVGNCDTDPDDGHCNLEGGADTCADLKAKTALTYEFEVTIDCSQIFEESDTTIVPTGYYVEVPNCRVWTQKNDSVIAPCTGISTLPITGTGSKCDCSPLRLPVRRSPCFGINCSMEIDCDTTCTDEADCRVTVEPSSSSPGEHTCFCPYKGIKDSTFDGVCRTSRGECDVPESCDSTDSDTPVCPDDTFKDTSTECDTSFTDGKCYRALCTGYGKCGSYQTRPGNVCCDGSSCTEDYCRPDFDSTILDSTDADSKGCAHVFENGNFRLVIKYDDSTVTDANDSTCPDSRRRF